MMGRYYTVAEANAALRWVRPLVGEMLAIRQRIVERQPEVWPILSKAAGNGGGKAASELSGDFERLDEMVRKLKAADIELKDINTGLIDFRGLREGREVYLCWQYGEERVLYWHELHTGFAGRRPLD
jgi:hypothetical protein